MLIAPLTLAESFASLLRANARAGRACPPAGVEALLIALLLQILACIASPPAPRARHTPRHKTARRTCSFRASRRRTRAARLACIRARPSHGRRRIATWRAAHEGARAVPGHPTTPSERNPTLAARAPPLLPPPFFPPPRTPANHGSRRMPILLRYQNF